MSTLNDIIDFMRSGTKPFREWEEGVVKRATDPNEFGKALADSLSMDPRTGDYGVIGIGAVHGRNSSLFPASWKGKDGRLKQLQDEGLSKQEIWDKAREETGFGIWDQPIYKNGELVRSDIKMNVPDINLKQGPVGVDDLGDLSGMQNYPAKAFRENTSMEAGYPGAYNAGTVQITDNAQMLGEPMSYKLGKYSDKGKVGYNVNKEADYLPATEDSLLPRFAAMDQGIIQDVERFAPGGRGFDSSTTNLAGNVEQRAVESEFKTIMQLRAEGMDNLQIIDRLGNKPIFQNMDTPDILQQTVSRRELAPPAPPSGKAPRSSVGKPVPVPVSVPVPQPAIKTESIDKIRFPTRSKKPKNKKDITALLEEMINYV